MVILRPLALERPIEGFTFSGCCCARICSVGQFPARRMRNVNQYRVIRSVRTSIALVHEHLYMRADHRANRAVSPRLLSGDRRHRHRRFGSFCAKAGRRRRGRLVAARVDRRVGPGGLSGSAPGGRGRGAGASSPSASPSWPVRGPPKPRRRLGRTRADAYRYLGPVGRGRIRPSVAAPRRATDRRVRRLSAQGQQQRLVEPSRLKAEQPRPGRRPWRRCASAVSALRRPPSSHVPQGGLGAPVLPPRAFSNRRRAVLRRPLPEEAVAEHAP